MVRMSDVFKAWQKVLKPASVSVSQSELEQMYTTPQYLSTTLEKYLEDIRKFNLLKGQMLHGHSTEWELALGPLTLR